MTKGDHLAYRRAARVSVLGLVLQAILTVVFFVYARFTGDHGAGTAVWLLGSGVIVWAILILVYDQLRRERLEAIEAEQLASSSAATSAFDTSGDDLRVAARRLVTIQKWVVPLAGVVVASINITGGILRFQSWAGITDKVVAVPAATGVSLALGLSVAIVMFVFARFVSGMGTLKPWANLRAGAAQAVGIALIGVLIGTTSFLDLALSQDWLGVFAPYIIAGLLVVLGAETVLHLVLNLYRPRSVHEDPRPAFDSRLLGMVAAPDRIAESVGEAVNYQFGVDISGSWFYQLLSRWIVGLIAMGVLIAWLLTTIVVVQPHQRGLVLTFGSVTPPILSMGDRSEAGDIGPGLHIKWPWPISTFEIPTVGDRNLRGAGGEQQASAGVRVLQLASAPPDDPTKPVLWGEAHATREMLNIVQPGPESTLARDGGTAANAGLSLLAIEVPVHYIVRDVKLFDQFASPAARERLLTSVGRRVVTQHIGQLTIDQILAGQRSDLSLELKRRLEAAYAQFNDGRGAGIEILFVGAHGVHPPVKVAPNFERVVQARQNREALIEDALKTKTATLTQAAGSVDLADQIVALLDRLDRVRGSATDEETELELEVQRLLEQTGGQAGVALLDAGAQRWNRHMSERGRSALLRGQNVAYTAAPALFQSRMYFDALREAMAGARVFVTPESLTGLHIRLELQDGAAGRDILDETAGAPLAQ
jgi:regulator of protease activity HflC (stomatin/prohibitin superfamily)